MLRTQYKYHYGYKALMLVITLIISLLISKNVQALTIGEKAPDFTLKNRQGNNQNLTEQRGSIILLNFWATWCAPCKEEMPSLDKLQINEQFNTALKSKNKTSVSTFRLILAAIKERDIANRSGGKKEEIKEAINFYGNCMYSNYLRKLIK